MKPEYLYRDEITEDIKNTVNEIFQKEIADVQKSEEIKKKEAAGEKSVIRLKVPKNEQIVIEDMVRGTVKFDTNLIDDQVLLKSDGFPTYHFAVVIDDHLMEITDIIRGEEWLPSTPKHVILYNYFGWKIPNYAHLSLLVNEKKQKLSKRHGDVSVFDFKEKGYLPESLLNFVALLGWNPGDEREIFSLKELEKEFDIKKVGKSASVFDINKLDWMTGQYIKKMSDATLAELILPFLNNSGLCNGISADNSLLMPLAKMCKERMSKLSDIVELSGFIFADFLDYDSDLLIWKKSDLKTTKDNLESLLEFLNEVDARSEKSFGQ